MSSPPERHDTVQVPIPVRSAAGQRSVLVVDDDAALARSIQHALKRAGFEVVLAENGSVAVQTIMGRPFDVILSDIQMPEMSGLQLLGVIRAYDLDVPVILMTGDPTIETAMEAVSLGALQYLPKPTPNDVLVAAVERASKLHRMADMKRDALRIAGGDGMLAGDRVGLQTGFDKALATMWMAFQPIVDAKQRRIFGYEALLRSTEPSLPHPGAVLSAAERLNRLPALGQRVRELSAEGFAGAPAGTTLFVNLHTRDLLAPTLYAREAPLAAIADRVILEITERSTIDDIKDIQTRIKDLRRLGYRIAIDDLGAGYAGLSSFAALEPDIVKLDMSLVRDVHNSEVRKGLIRSMTVLCKEMGMLVVAEGVEVAEERSCVLGVGCDLLQGYLLAKPGRPFPTVEGIS
jgi:EAL domain-containing protein (putative c-di-GMP-specific phosphodiesterase class I)